MSYAGWDWASRAHDVTVLDDGGAVLYRWAFAHTESGWQMALGRLRSHGEPGDLPVIIEKTSGLIVDRILAAGHPVVPVHLNSFCAARPRRGASGAKSDPGDRYKLADYLRTDGHRLRRIEPADAGLRELQIITSEGATVASTVTYLLPVVAIVLGVLVLDEHATVLVLLGIALILAGGALARNHIKASDANNESTTRVGQAERSP